MKKAGVFFVVILSITTGLFAQDGADKNSKVIGEMAIEQMSFTVTSIQSALDGKQTTYEQDSKALNIMAPLKIPGSNVAIRIGAKFPIL